MPTYAYHCAGCSHEMESLQKITAKPLTRCPRCGEDKLVRGPGGGAGLLFLGSGFYCTDYQTGSQKSAGKSENLSQTSSSTGNGCSHSGCGCIGKNK